MTGNEYQTLAMRTINPDINDILSNGVMGLCGESGEVIDHVKKYKFHGHALDRAAIEKELGDVLWYVAEIASALDLTMDDIMEKNILKLKTRFPNGFTTTDSINRVDEGQYV